MIEQRDYATCVAREVHGRPQIVVVCHSCDEVKVISLREAMQAALTSYLNEHKDDLAHSLS